MHGNPHIGLHTVRGTPLGNGRQLIDSNARLGLRLPSDLLPRSRKLAERASTWKGAAMRVGVGETRGFGSGGYEPNPWPRGNSPPARLPTLANGIVPTAMPPLSTYL